MSKSALIKSSIAKKYWMALTGLFLCLFLIGHLAGNLQLLVPMDGGAREGFNNYAYFMTHNPAILILSYLTYFSILFHAIDGIMLAIQNQKSRSKSYVKNKPGKSSSLAARNMAPLGLILLLFIIGHMWQFWGQMHFGDLPTYTNADGNEVTELYALVILFFKNQSTGLIWACAYGVCMLAIAMHLWHGFQSAFQSLGARTGKYKIAIVGFGRFFAVFIPLAFAIIPFYIHFVLSINESQMINGVTLDNLDAIKTYLNS